VPEHTIVSDGRLVIQSNNEGVPFVLANPQAPVSQDVMRVATQVLGTGRVAAAGRS
jgi:MinD-like ATPase involved in chromosome partitioning or flagellar assembly